MGHYFLDKQYNFSCSISWPKLSYSGLDFKLLICLVNVKLLIKLVKGSRKKVLFKVVGPLRGGGRKGRTSK